MTKMTTEEAFVKVLQMHGIEHAFGIIGSAFMPISHIFPNAGINPRHPSQLYEAGFEGLILFTILLVIVYNNGLKKKGLISGTFLFFYSFSRIIIAVSYTHLTLPTTSTV